MANLPARLLISVVTCVISPALPACGLLDNVVPRLASEGGEESVQVSPVVDTSGTRSLPAAIDGLQLEIVDVLLHDPNDDVWLILNDHSIAWQPFNAGVDAPRFSEVPVIVGTYDALEIHFGAARVQVGGQWQSAVLTKDVLRFDGAIKLRNDAQLSLLFDFDAAVAQNSGGQWSLTPAVSTRWE